MLDPQWKEQRQKSDARQATTTLSTLDIAANLKMDKVEDRSQEGAGKMLSLVDERD